MTNLETMMMIKEKFIDDEMIVFAVDDLIESVADYVNTVNGMETRIQMIRFRMEGDDMRDAIQTLDRKRRIVHNALISKVKLVNRICESENIDAIYSGDIEDRYAIADWAGEIFKALVA